MEYLTSDELEGRGVGTEGLDNAAARIADNFCVPHQRRSRYTVEC